MPIIAGPFHVVAALLLVAGAAKLLRPGSTADVARAAGMPASRLLVRLFAVAEITAGVTAIVVGGPLPAVTVGMLFLAFAGFVVMLKVRGIETAGCGCFGQESEEPPGSLHVAVDVVSGVIAIVAAVASVPDITAVLVDQPLGGVPYVGFVVLGTWLTVVMLTDLPRLVYLTAESTT